MKITEIANEARKTINKLQKMYLSYSLNANNYNELVDFMSVIGNTTDIDVLRELDIIRVALYNEVIAILKK
jgi:hypothetical protein